MAKLSIANRGATSTPGSFEIVVDRSAQDSRDLGDADEGLALEIVWAQGFPRSEPMVMRQDGHERLLQQKFVFEVRLGLVAQKGDVDPSVHKVVGERH